MKSFYGFPAGGTESQDFFPFFFLALFHFSGFSDLCRVIENDLSFLGMWAPPLRAGHFVLRRPTLQGNAVGNETSNL